MIDIIAEDRRDRDGEKREYREDGLSGAAFEAHNAIDDQRHDSGCHQAIFQPLVAFDEVAGESADSNQKHNDVLDYGDSLAGPERPGGGFGQGEVALQHIHGIFLEREYRRIVKDAEKGHEPETEAGEDLANVRDLERVVFLLGLTGLAVELLVHEEICNEHDKGDAKKHDSESHGTADIDLSAELGEIGRENHAGGHSQTGESHL